MAFSPPKKKEEIGDFLDKVPPQDLEAERCVLGSILLLNESIDEVQSQITHSCFYADSHRRIYKAVQEMYEAGVRGIDAVTLRDELARRAELDVVGGTPYILQILETVPHAAHAEYYAKIVREKWLQRSLIEACTESLKEAYHGHTDIEKILSQAEQRIFGIVEDGASIDKMALGDIMDDAFQRIFARIDAEGTTSGLTSGFQGLDEMTGGFQETELLVLAARPSMGKTALVCNFALAGAAVNEGVLIFSLEMSSLELAERFLCMHAKVDGHKVRQGTLDEVEQHALMESSNVLKAFPLYIDDQAGRTISQIASISRRLKRRFDIKLIIIDYLQLIESDDKALPREQQVSTITRRLKFLAKDLRVPVIALAQLNRGVETREDKRPRLADLRESGAIEQDADIVMFLHRPDAYDPEDRPGEADLIVAKNRHGPIGTVELVWLKKSLKFGDKSPMQDPVDF
ncbi:MAG: replicative DNA helicase [Planctomycetaceae bacterium]